MDLAVTVFRPSLLALVGERGRKTADSQFAPAVRCSAADSLFVLAERCCALPARSSFVGWGGISAIPTRHHALIPDAQGAVVAKFTNPNRR
jgi:hypothetical protein